MYSHLVHTTGYQPPPSTLERGLSRTFREGHHMQAYSQQQVPLCQRTGKKNFGGFLHSQEEQTLVVRSHWLGCINSSLGRIARKSGEYRRIVGNLFFQLLHIQRIVGRHVNSTKFASTSKCKQCDKLYTSETKCYSEDH